MSPSDSSADSNAGGGASRAFNAAAAAVDTPDLQLLREELQAAVGAEYTVAECLGRGGMGAVFRANQETLDRAVAIKVMLPSGSIPRADWIERFQREAKALAGLSHPSIVGVHTFGQTDQLAWIVMESVDGASLRSLMDEGQLTPAEALELAPQICRAIQYAHDHGVVHRDIKPENVLVNALGEVKLVDFGLALLREGADGVRMTSTQEVLGTLRYMAPEQLDTPKEVDHRADIFSLGVVMYEMLTGKVPQGVIEPPSHRVEVDVRLDEVVLRALEREPERRFQSASDVAYRMDQIEQNPSLAGAPESHHGADEDRPLIPNTDIQARLSQFQLGFILDLAVVLAMFAAIAPYIVTVATEYSLGSSLCELCLALMAALSIPWVFRSALNARTSMVPMGMLRVACSLAALAVLFLVDWEVAAVLDSKLVPGKPTIYSLAYSILAVCLLPTITAVLSTPYPIGFQWSGSARAIIVTLGTLVALAAAVTGLMPWNEDSSLARWMFVALFVVLSVAIHLGSKLHTPYRLDKARGLAMAAAGVAGVCLVWISEVRPTELTDSWSKAALAVSVTIGLLGGLLGAGTRLRDLPSATANGATT